MIILYKIPVHTGMKGNEEIDRTAKQAIDMPRMITARLLLDHQED